MSYPRCKRWWEVAHEATSLPMLEMAVGLAISVGDDAKACNDCLWKRRLQPAAIRNSGGLTKFLGAIYFWT
jgi:hypothetical protein